MKTSYWYRSAIGVTLPLILAISVRAADLITMPDYRTAEPTAFSNGPCFEPDWDGGTMKATVCSFQQDCCSVTPSNAACWVHADYSVRQAAACSFQQDCGCVTPPATACCSQPNSSCVTSQSADCCPQPDCCCGGIRCGTGCGGFAGGAEVAFLRPYFNDNVGLNRLATSRGSTYDSTSEFTPSYDASPRLWLGYANACGFGGRLRYWVYDQATNPQVGVQKDSSILYFAPGIVAGVNGNTGNIETTFAGDTVTASEHLHMYTFDAEITQCLQLCCWDFTLGGGLRDAGVHIDRVNTLLPAGATVATEVADIGNHFDGVGPTVFAEFGRPFGCGGLAFVGNLRGSLLYGTKSLRGTDVSILGTQAYDNTTDGCLGVGEVSLGIEWAREISCNTKVFARGLWENQIWFNMGNSTSITGDNLGLGGFTLAAGLCR